MEIRKTRVALQKGGFSWVETARNLVAFKRIYGNESILVIINNTPEKVKFSLPKDFSRAIDLLKLSKNKNVIEPFSIKILS